MLLMGLFTAIGFFVFVMKLPVPIRSKLLGFDLLLDIAATLAMMLAFAGTFSGMSAAILGGLIFSAMLITAKWLFGYETATWQHGRIYWTTHPGLFSPRTRRPHHDLT